MKKDSKVTNLVTDTATPEQLQLNEASKKDCQLLIDVQKLSMAASHAESSSQLSKQHKALIDVEKSPKQQKKNPKGVLKLNDSSLESPTKTKLH